MTVRRSPFAVVLLVLLAAACLRADASPVSVAGSGLEFTPLTATLPGPFDDAIGRAVTSVWLDIDEDGDLDVVGVDGTAGLRVWVNDGNGRLSLQRPCDPTLLSSEAADVSLDSPSAVDNTDQSDAASIGFDNGSGAVVPRYSRPLNAESSAMVRSRTRSSCTPRAPPLPSRRS